MTLTPGVNSSRVRSGNDLNPLSVIDFRCTVSVPHRVERRARRRLLGILLAATGAASSLLARDRGGNLERAVVRWAALGAHLVADELAAARQQLLQRRLEGLGGPERG